jgi:hypothetical protein
MLLIKPAMTLQIEVSINFQKIATNGIHLNTTHQDQKVVSLFSSCTDFQTPGSDGKLKD